MKQTVLDASALISFFENRTGGDRVEELISESPIGKAELVMSVVNWGEVYYSAWHAHGENAARQMAAEISQIPIHLLNADLDLTKCAAKLRGRYRLPSRIVLRWRCRRFERPIL